MLTHGDGSGCIIVLWLSPQRQRHQIPWSFLLGCNMQAWHHVSQALRAAVNQFIFVQPRFGWRIHCVAWGNSLHVAETLDGRLLVSDYQKNCIHVCTSTLIYTWEQWRLQGPYVLVVHGREVAVCEKTRVVILTDQGQFVRAFPITSWVLALVPATQPGGEVYLWVSGRENQLLRIRWRDGVAVESVCLGHSHLTAVHVSYRGLVSLVKDGRLWRMNALGQAGTCALTDGTSYFGTTLWQGVRCLSEFQNCFSPNSIVVLRESDDEFLSGWRLPSMLYGIDKLTPECTHLVVLSGNRLALCHEQGVTVYA